MDNFSSWWIRRRRRRIGSLRTLVFMFRINSPLDNELDIIYMEAFESVGEILMNQN